MAPVGATLVPPEIPIEPEAVNEPDPVYAPTGLNVKFPAEVEFAYTANAAAESIVVPPTPEVVAALTVVAPVVDFNLTVPPEVAWFIVKVPPVTETVPVAESALPGVKAV